MSETGQKLLDAVRKLPAAEQEELAEAVYDGLMTPEEDEALFAELERRRAEHESGHAPGITVEEVYRQLRAEFGKPA